MPSLQGRILRPLLRVQRLAQRVAAIEGTRRMSRPSERPGKLPRGVSSGFFTQGSLLYEWLTPTDFDAGRVLYYLHGGGFVFPLWNPLRRVIAYIVSEARMRALAVHYRLAPEHPFPAAVEDCVAGYRWLISEGGIDPENIAFAGESAGANLVIATLLALRDAGDPLPRRAVPFCGPFDLEAGGAFTSRVDVLFHPHFVSRQMLAYRGDADPRHPLVSPIYADLRGLPPLLIQVGSKEGFLDDCTALAKKAQEAGVTVTLEVWPDMWHYWHMMVPFLPEARRAIQSIADFVSLS
jgi:acetyl esterase/lipase